MRILKSLIVSIGLLFSAPAFSSPVDIIGAPLIDFGGNLIDRMMTISLLEQAEVDVKISGVCISACTMYLGLPKVCVQPKTIFGFHSAYTIDEKGKEVPSPFGNSVLMEHYPQKVKNWVEEKKALETTNLTFANAETMWVLGIPKCDDKKL